MDVVTTTPLDSDVTPAAAHPVDDLALRVEAPDPDQLAAARNLRRRARTAAGLTSLYAARADLDGVSPVAQFYAESVRWTA